MTFSVTFDIFQVSPTLVLRDDDQTGAQRRTKMPQGPQETFLLSIEWGV